MRTQFQIEFIGGIKITDLNPIGYKVELNLDHSENPVVLMADLPDDKFMEFIKEELRNRKLHKTEYFKAIKIQPNQQTLCYDRARTYR